VGCGTVLKLDPSGKETVLHSFNGNDGSLPFADLILDEAGNLYGTTELGGSSNKGSVFKLGGRVAPDFSLTAAFFAIRVNSGGEASDTITVAPHDGSLGKAIQLTCSIAGPVPMPTCSLSPSSVTPGAGSVTSTLTIAAPAAAVMQLRPGGSQSSYSLYALGLALISSIAVFGKRKPKSRPYWSFCSFLLLSVVLQTACGGGSLVRPTTDYTVTIAGSSGAILHTTQVTVTVQ